jgi:hypothetical protein
MRPIGFECRSGCSMISTVTTSPARALTAPPGRDQNVLVDPPIFRYDNRDSVLQQDAANDPAVGPFQHFDDDSLTPPAAVGADDAHQRAIAMQDLGHLPGFERQVLAAVVGNQKTIAIGMALDAPGDQAGALGQDVGALAIAQQLRLALHCPQAALKRLQLGFLDIKQYAELVESDGFALFLQNLQDVFARRQGLLVALDLTLEVRVAPAYSRQFDD